MMKLLMKRDLPLIALFFFIIALDTWQWFLAPQVIGIFVLSIPISIVILVIFLFYLFLYGIQRTDMTRLYSELSIFVGAELGVAGEIVYEVCGPPIVPGSLGLCHYVVNPMFNFVGLAIFIFGIITSVRFANMNPEREVKKTVTVPPYLPYAPFITTNEGQGTLPPRLQVPQQGPLGLLRTLAPLVAFLTVILTALPLMFIAFQNGSSWISALDEQITWFFAFWYFPIVGILNPLCYAGFLYLKYRSFRGLSWYILGTTLPSFLLVGVFWFWVIIWGLIIGIVSEP